MYCAVASQALVAESHTHKTEANALFNAGSYTQALTRYSDATAVCPTYLDFDLAVLQSNISACHLKLEEWKDAVASATAALGKLDKIDAQLAAEEKAAAAEKEKEAAAADDDEVDEEIVSAGAGKSAPAPATGDDPEDPAAAARRKRREDALRIRYKALMRRARARSEEGGWSNLAGAEEDYKALAGMPNVAPGDRKIVAAQLRALPPRVKAAQEQETAEMWGKLKEVSRSCSASASSSFAPIRVQVQEPADAKFLVGTSSWGMAY